jgi:hypothetical protein
MMRERFHRRLDTRLPWERRKAGLTSSGKLACQFLGKLRFGVLYHFIDIGVAEPSFFSVAGRCRRGPAGFPDKRRTAIFAAEFFVQFPTSYKVLRSLLYETVN